MSEICINLSKSWHWDKEQLLLKHGKMHVEYFRYTSGTYALRITNAVGEIVCLPFQGQQIWDAIFLGRSLKMRSMFDQPRPAQDFLNTYGALLIHCGATAMGPPGESDMHPPHGELPNAEFDSAALYLGTDDDGAYIKLTGQYHHTIAFNTNYVFRPTIKLSENLTQVSVSLEIENLKNTPMELMYLAHVNFKASDGIKIFDNASGVKLRDKLPSHVVASRDVENTFQKLKSDPNAHRCINPETIYDPEIVLYLDIDAKEATHLAVQDDGAADFIQYSTQFLPHTMRWISRTPDQQCLGLALPATAQVDGLNAEREKGNVIILDAKQTYRCSYEFGCVEQAAVETLQNLIINSKEA